MPVSAGRPCRHVGCAAVVFGAAAFCPRHLSAVRAASDSRRGSANHRGYGAKWRRARAVFLRANPVCVRCGREASEVDHVIPHRSDMALFWDSGNWQALCKSCHSRKTAAEDGGFRRAGAGSGG